MSQFHHTDTLTGPGWTLSYTAYDPADERRRETILALGNGVVVTRAASADARANECHYPGTYRAACYDRLRTCIRGEVDETESLVNLPNWLYLTFRPQGEHWFSLDAVDLLDYSHTLDLKAGMASREFTFCDDLGRRTHCRELRLNSMEQPHLLGLRLEIRPENWSGELEVCSAVDGDLVNANVTRYEDYPLRHFEVLDREAFSAGELALTARTLRSNIQVAEVVRTQLHGAVVSENRVVRERAAIADYFQCFATEGKTLTVEKVAALYSSQDSIDCQPIEAARAALRKVESFTSLRNGHEQAWDQLWRRIDIATENEAAALALRFHAFHVLQTVSPHSSGLDAGVPARGWHGEGYRGHIFWDDLFVFPFLNFRLPDLARSLLLYRYRRLDAARQGARAAGYRGAMFPWRSASAGEEVTPRHQKNLLSGRWMSDPTRLQYHIGSAVAYNVWHYYLATGDAAFLADYGAEMMLEVARFWASVAEYSASCDRYEIKGVIGPDEYHNSYPGRSSPGLDNNAYTNIMAVWTLCRALEVLDCLPAERREGLVRELELEDDELEHWDTISRKMRIVFHSEGIISQFEGFEKLRAFSSDLLPPDLADERVDWALEAIGENADSYQVTKQADTLTLFYLLSPEEVIALLDRLGYSFDCDHLLRTADYYLERTTHRSSLSRIIYAGALARVDPRRSWDLYRQSLDTDLHALKGESIAEGIHLGAMGGTLDILQRCYLGIDTDPGGALRIRPKVPPELGKVHLGFHYRGSNLLVIASSAGLFIRCEEDSHNAVTLMHESDRKLLHPGEEYFIDPG